MGEGAGDEGKKWPDEYDPSEQRSRSLLGSQLGKSLQLQRTSFGRLFVIENLDSNSSENTRLVAIESTSTVQRRSLVLRWMVNSMILFETQFATNIFRRLEFSFLGSQTWSFSNSTQQHLTETILKNALSYVKSELAVLAFEALALTPQPPLPFV